MIQLYLVTHRSWYTTSLPFISKTLIGPSSNLTCTPNHNNMSLKCLKHLQINTYLYVRSIIRNQYLYKQIEWGNMIGLEINQIQYHMQNLRNNSHDEVLQCNPTPPYPHLHGTHTSMATMATLTSMSTLTSMATLTSVATPPPWLPSPPWLPTPAVIKQVASLLLLIMLQVCAQFQYLRFSQPLPYVLFKCLG